MKKSIILLLMSSLLMACQTTPQAQHSLSYSEAENLPVLSGLPVLTISTVNQQQGQRIVKLHNEDNETFLMTVADNTSQAKIPLNVGKKIKVIGDYAEITQENNQTIIQITPEKITLLH